MALRAVRRARKSSALLEWKSVELRVWIRLELQLWKSAEQLCLLKTKKESVKIKHNNNKQDWVLNTDLVPSHLSRNGKRHWNELTSVLFDKSL